MNHQIEYTVFHLDLTLEVFKDDISYPTNTLMTIYVKSGFYTGHATMDINIKEFKKFIINLQKIYETLNGEAIIKETYGYQMYLSFEGDGLGHINVRGLLVNGDMNGNMQRLEFENNIDQTVLRKFINDLKQDINQYLL